MSPRPAIGIGAKGTESTTGIKGSLDWIAAVAIKAVLRPKDEKAVFEAKRRKSLESVLKSLKSCFRH
jgi:hypothetical protein